MVKYLILTLSLVVVLCTCYQSSSLRFIKASSRRNLKEVRLGQSNYYVKIPQNFEITEVWGKEGSLGYDITPRDTSSPMFGFIGIIAGHPIGVDPHDSAKPFATSLLAGKTVEWKMERSETGYYEAFTDEKGEPSAAASSTKASEVDSLISIIATLKRK